MYHPQVQLPTHIGCHTQAELVWMQRSEAWGQSHRCLVRAHMLPTLLGRICTMFQDCYDCEGHGWVGGEPKWFWLLPGLVLVPDALGYEEELLCTQNQESSKTFSSRKSLPSPATRSDKTYPLTPPGSSLGVLSTNSAQCLDGWHMPHLLVQILFSV